MSFFSDTIKPLFRPFYNPIFDAVYRFRVDHFLKRELERRWLEFAGKPIDWDNPKTLNEKIQWLICFSDLKEWTRLADKVLVRDYVKEKGLEDILIPIIGTWGNANEIDFDALPNKCVLKCNHDCGSVIVIDKEKGYDKKAIIARLNSKLEKKYGYWNCEIHYNDIKPCIVCEVFLELDSNGISASPIDYKVFCYNGEPDTILVVYNRNKEYVELETYDVEWNYRPEWGVAHGRHRKGSGRIPCPESLAQMIRAAKILSEGMPQVRIDFYDVNGKLYFGEMTFTSLSGRMPYFSDIYQERAGELIDLSLAKQKIK